MKAEMPGFIAFVLLAPGLLVGCGNSPSATDPPIGGEVLIVRDGDRDGRGELVLIDVSSGNARSLPIDVAVYEPVWSPDGQKIALSRGDESGGQSIGIFSMDTGEFTFVPLDAGVYVEVSWSPDGEWIAFSGAPFAESGDHQRPPQLWIVQPDGSDLRQLSDGSIGGVTPSWSPDSRRLAYLPGGLAGPENGPLWIVDIADGTRRTVSVANVQDALFPAWSPAGDWIAFVAYPETHPLYSSVFVVRPDGSDLRELAGDGLGAGSPAWSPDGTTLAYYANDTDRFAYLFTEEVPAGAKRQLTDEEAHGVIVPAWSPDGEWIAFSSDRSGSELNPLFELRIVAVGGDDVEPVTFADDLLQLPRPAWRPNSQT